MAKPNPIRMGILLGVLGIVLIALLWDQFVARAGSQSAYEAVNGMVQGQLAASKDEGMKGPEDVHELLGRKPSSSEPIGDYKLVERYNWIRGTLVSSFYVNVVYKKRNDDWYLEKVLLNDDETEGEGEFGVDMPGDEPGSVAPDPDDSDPSNGQVRPDDNNATVDPAENQATDPNDA